MTSTTTTDAGRAFLALHRAERGFVMPNAWDIGSAVVLASEGFAAIGTTSAGIAFSLGKPDYDVRDARLAVGRDEMLEAARRIAGAVAIPVNVDLEAGYGDTPEAVADTVRLAIAAGAAGCNLEDVDRATGQLLDEAAAVARLRAARERIVASGRCFVLNARTDAVLLGGAKGMRDAIARGNRYLEAGADCVFTPGICDVATARLAAREIQGPLNVVVGLNEAGSSAAALIDAGVQRVSVGGSIARAALGLVRRSARELRERGTVTYAAEQIPQAELNALFERAWRQNGGSLRS
jgi:2-methylisocitrate lyase-like PEP mutase family enzyme